MRGPDAGVVLDAEEHNLFPGRGRRGDRGPTAAARHPRQARGQALDNSDHAGPGPVEPVQPGKSSDQAR